MCAGAPRNHAEKKNAGTGKTATFAVSILQKIDVSSTDCQALVLAPTRELAQQIVKVVRALGDFMQLQVGGGDRLFPDALSRSLASAVVVVIRGFPGFARTGVACRAVRHRPICLLCLKGGSVGRFGPTYKPRSNLHRHIHL